jgi:hypothetical protein
VRLPPGPEDGASLLDAGGWVLVTVTSAATQAVDQIGSPSGLGGGDWAQ